MTHRKRTYFLLFSFFLPGLISAQTPLTLENAIETAVKNNKQLAAYKLRVEEKTIAASSFLFADKTKVYYGYDQANVADNGHPLRTVGVEQTLPFPTIYGVRNKLENQFVIQAQFEFEKQKRLLAKNVTRTYYDICFEQLRRENLQRVDSLYRKITRGAEIRYTKGDISKLDLLNAQARLQQISLQLKETETTISAYYAALKTLMQSDEPVVVSQKKIRPISIETADIEQNTDIQLGKTMINTMKLTAKMEKQVMLPDINLNYFYGNNPFENARGYHGFQVGLSIPLFFKDHHVRVKAANVAVKISEMQLENDKITMNNKRLTLSNELKRQRLTMDAYQETGEKLAAEILRTAEKSYQAGEIDFYQLAQSVENALKLTTDYYQAVINYNHTALEINYLTAN